MCHRCKQTFSDTQGTILYGLKYPYWLVLTVLALLGHGCPVPAIVAAFGIDERTVHLPPDNDAWRLLSSGPSLSTISAAFITPLKPLRLSL